MLTPVENPTAYGLVETDAGRRRRGASSRSRRPTRSRCDTINAGIYVLEPETFDRIPKDTPYSIERSYFPSLVERGETFVAYVYRGYWIDIGTPGKYVQVHRDIMDGTFSAGAVRGAPRVVVAPGRHIEDGAVIGPVLHRRRGVVKAGARIGPYTVIGRQMPRRGRRDRLGSILWPNTLDRPRRQVGEAIVGRNCHIGRNASVARRAAVLGDKSVLTDFTQV